MSWEKCGPHICYWFQNPSPSTSLLGLGRAWPHSNGPWNSLCPKLNSDFFNYPDSLWSPKSIPPAQIPFHVQIIICDGSPKSDTGTSNPMCPKPYCLSSSSCIFLPAPPDSQSVASLNPNSNSGCQSWFFPSLLLLISINCYMLLIWLPLQFSATNLFHAGLPYLRLSRLTSTTNSMLTLLVLSVLNPSAMQLPEYKIKPVSLSS